MPDATRVKAALAAAAKAAAQQRRTANAIRKSLFAAAKKTRKGAGEQQRLLGEIYNVNLAKLRRLAAASRKLAVASKGAPADPVRAALKGHKFPPPASMPRRFPHKGSPPPPSDDPVSLPVCFFSAHDGDVPPGPANMINLANSQLVVAVASTGEMGRLGLKAEPSVDPPTASLRWVFVPPIDGNLTVAAAVLVTGYVKVESHFWFPSVWADAQLDFELSIRQGPLVLARDKETATHLHVDGDDEDVRSFLNEAFPRICEGFVVHDDPVVVEFTATFRARGNSDLANAYLYFTPLTTGAAGVGIRVPEICMFLGPPVPVNVL
jgi:hypothetical protein